MAKTIKIQKFKYLANKPAQPKKGISYAVEKAENMNAKTGKKMNGDIFKKYKNGVLKRQIFVSKEGVKKLVQNSLRRMKKKTGGLTKKNKKTKNQKTRIVYVQAPPPAPGAPPAPVVIQEGTGIVQIVKSGVGTGVGLGIANAIGDAVVGMFSSDE